MQSPQTEGARSVEYLRDALQIIEEKARGLDIPRERFRILWSTIFAHTSPHSGNEIRRDRAQHTGQGFNKEEEASSETVTVPCITKWNSPIEGAEAWLGYGNYQLKQGLLDDAAYSFNLSIHFLNGVNLKLLINAARLFQKAGFPLAALWMAANVLARNPEDRDASRIIAATVCVLENTARLAVLEKVQKAVACSAIALSLAECYSRIGEIDQTRRMLNKVRGQWRESASYKWLSYKVAQDHQTKEARTTMLTDVAFATGADAQLAIACAVELVAEGANEQAEHCLLKALSLDHGEENRLEVLEKLAKFPAANSLRCHELPLVLVSQIQRSGGTLLSQLLDGHPQLLVHPHELHIGYPKKWNWPQLDLKDTPMQWLANLLELPLLNLILGGYQKPDRNPYAAEKSFPFNLSIAGLCSSFLARFANTIPKSQREILNAYFDAFFDSWPGQSFIEKKFYAGFTPRLLSNYGSVKRFFSDYPDGMLIVVIRDPYTWFSSSKRHDQEYQDLKNAIELWRCSTLSALLHAKENPKRLHVLTYEDLVRNTRAEMHMLAIRLGLKFSESLMTPTFMGHPILANSSYAIAETGVHQNSLDTASFLSEQERAYIQNEADDLYQETKRFVQAQTKSIMESKANVFLRAAKFLR